VGNPICVHGRRRLRPAVALGLSALTLVALAPATAQAASSDPYKVSIRRTAHGIPHVIAGDYASLGYGYGYALAQDNLCVLADTYVTVRAERSRYFRPDEAYPFRANGTRPNNLNSDFFYQRIIDQQIVERLIAESPPAGPLPEVEELVRGYVAGYNAYLRDIGVDRIPDPACRGKPWVKPIEEIDAYRRFYQLALLASSGVAIDGIGGAAPVVPLGSDQRSPAAREHVRAALEAQRRALDSMTPSRFDELLGGLGSNAYGLGRQATQSGRGMVLGNPHFPWDGAERFYQAQLTIPGKFDVAGSSLFGVPLINIGFTRGMAWSHTVSTARRFTPFELKLAPGSATTYLVDGVARSMKATKVTVMVPGTGGRLQPATRTLYDTEYGPVITSILGLPVFPWTPASAYAMGDVNASNFRYLNHFFLTNRAQTVGELDEVERRYLGIPWVNTIAADSTGKAYYADIGAIPNVSHAKIDQCSTALGVATDRSLRVQVLDGSRSACRWDTDPDAIRPGIFGPRNLPSLVRDDYVSNSNDSYWLTNPRQPLEGFSRVIGDERTTRTPRTRLGLRIVQQRLDGSDGLPGRGFTVDQLADAVLNNRQYLGEQWRDDAVAMCRQSPVLMGSGGFVDVSQACDVLQGWDLRDDLDSKGAVLFRRFASRAVGAPGGAPLNPFAAYVWARPFDPSDPVNTPAGLNTAHPQVRQALADAVTDLQRAGIPLDAPLRGWQYEKRGEEKIPIGGGPGGLGVFNAINVTWNLSGGYPDVPHGSSHIQAVEVTGGCPKAKTILTYSQSTSPESPWFADQTRLHSRKGWVDWRFCDAEIAADPKLQVLDVNGGFGTTSLVRRVRVQRARGGLVVLVTLMRPASVRVAVLRAGRRLRLVKRAGGRGTLRIRVRGLRRAGRYRVVVSATAGKRTETLRRNARVR
jgi:acyl-homoserine-lactone acylase